MNSNKGSADGFGNAERQQAKGGRRPRRPWDIQAGNREGGAPPLKLRRSPSEEGKVVEFPWRAQQASEKERPDDTGELLAKLKEQMEQLRLTKSEILQSTNATTERLREIERRKEELEAEIDRMRVTMANVDAQIWEVELLAELIRGLERSG